MKPFAKMAAFIVALAIVVLAVTEASRAGWIAATATLIIGMCANFWLHRPATENDAKQLEDSIQGIADGRTSLATRLDSGSSGTSGPGARSG